MIALVGAGCGAAEVPEEKDTPVATESVTKKSESKTTKVSSVEVPTDSELLPKDGEWNEVKIKNFGISFATEIHPWWHWDATSTALEGEGALFANSKDLLFGGNPDGVQYRITVKSQKDSSATSLEDAAQKADIKECKKINDVDDFAVCVAASKAVAVYHDGTYQWTVTLTHASDEKGQGYFLHMLESFAVIEG